MRASHRRELSELPRSSPRVVREFARDLRLLEIFGFIVLGIGICGLVLISATSAGRGGAEPLPLYSTPAPPPPSNVEISVSTASANLRFYYQYSVIPGGIRSAEELREALAEDPVVADHYADFGLKHVNFVTLGRDQAFYVSYRIPSGVFWTSRPMLLHRGEKLVTDGFNLARVRCGNRLSEVPLLPVSPMQPAPEEMNVASVVRAPQGILHAAHFFRPPIVFVPIIPFFVPPGGSGSPPFFSFAPLPAANLGVILLMCSLTLLLRFVLRRRIAASGVSARRSNRGLLHKFRPRRRSSDCESPKAPGRT